MMNEKFDFLINGTDLEICKKQCAEYREEIMKSGNKELIDAFNSGHVCGFIENLEDIYSGGFNHGAIYILGLVGGLTFILMGVYLFKKEKNKKVK